MVISRTSTARSCAAKSPLSQKRSGTRCVRSTTTARPSHRLRLPSSPRRAMIILRITWKPMREKSWTSTRLWLQSCWRKPLDLVDRSGGRSHMIDWCGDRSPWPCWWPVSFSLDRQLKATANAPMRPHKPSSNELGGLDNYLIGRSGGRSHCRPLIDGPPVLTRGGLRGIG